MRKFLLLSFILIIGFAAHAQTPNITFFYGKECPHCEEEIKFLDSLKKEIPNLEIVEYEVWHNEENRKLFLETTEKLGIKNPAVPLTIIGEKYLVGFDSPENYGQKIREMIKGGAEPEEKVSLPFLGEINLKTFSLPLLTIVLGTLDGFNPCSMWALLTLIILVLATGSRKKIWLVGSVFIITSYISYFLFMTAWLNLFIFLDYLKIVRIIIGLIAIIAGVISVREFYTFKPGICETSSFKQRQKISDRIKKALGSNTLPAIILGIIAVAFSVNLVELLCSLGLPVIFTKALTLHQLATWKYYTYIAFYDFFYMLDDIIVLFVAGFSLRLLQLDGKYSRWSRLIAGILMISLGAIFLLKPELLMF